MAFEAVDRAHFVPPEVAPQAYLDTPLPIGHGQTISAPSIVAMMTEALAPQPGQNLLEIGTGSGYQAAILAHLVGPKGKVTTLERLPELSKAAQATIGKHYPRLHKRICFAVADGSKGHPKHAPYDGILVTSAAPSIPKPLIHQLAEGGRMIIPVGSRYLQDLLLVQKSRGKTTTTSLTPVMFVPLVGQEGFSDSP